eukprot:9518469-Ditylum_brightwellii.AAC.1
MMQEGSSERTWDTADASCSDEGCNGAEAIWSGTAIAVSDGSYRVNGGAAACLLEGATPYHHRISATAT